MKLMHPKKMDDGDFTTEPIPNILPGTKTNPHQALKGLSNDERDAAFGSSTEYSDTYSRSLMVTMHAHAHQMPLNHLEPIFSHGLFNWYFNLYCRFNPNATQFDTYNFIHHYTLANYRGTVSPVTGNLKNTFPKHVLSVMHYLDIASVRLKENLFLRYLGSLFQKQKVRVEQLSKTSGAGVYEEDAHVELQQTVAARWIEQACNHIVSRIRENLKNDKDMDAHGDEFVQYLPYLRPKFLDDPHWAKAFHLLETENMGSEIHLQNAQDIYHKYQLYGFPEAMTKQNTTVGH